MINKKEKMTEKERLIAILNRQPVDRVPLFLLGFGFSARNVGFSTINMYEDAIPGGASVFHGGGEAILTFNMILLPSAG